MISIVLVLPFVVCHSYEEALLLSKLSCKFRLRDVIDNVSGSLRSVIKTYRTRMAILICHPTPVLLLYSVKESLAPDLAIQLKFAEIHSSPKSPDKFRIIPAKNNKRLCEVGKEQLMSPG